MNRDQSLELAAAARRFAELLEASVGGRSGVDVASTDLSVSGVGQVLGRSPSTVRGWLESGQLKGYKLPGDPKRSAWRVTPDALQAFRNRGDGTASIGEWRKQRGKAA